MNRAKQSSQNEMKNKLGPPPKEFFKVTNVARYRYNPYKAKHNERDPPNRWTLFKNVIKSLPFFCK